MGAYRRHCGGGAVDVIANKKRRLCVRWGIDLYDEKAGESAPQNATSDVGD